MTRTSRLHAADQLTIGLVVLAGMLAGFRLALGGGGWGWVAAAGLTLMAGLAGARRTTLRHSQVSVNGSTLIVAWAALSLAPGPLAGFAVAYAALQRLLEPGQSALKVRFNAALSVATTLAFGVAVAPGLGQDPLVVAAFGAFGAFASETFSMIAIHLARNTVAPVRVRLATSLRPQAPGLFMVVIAAGIVAAMIATDVVLGAVVVIAGTVALVVVTERLAAAADANAMLSRLIEGAEPLWEARTDQQVASAAAAIATDVFGALRASVCLGEVSGHAGAAVDNATTGIRLTHPVGESGLMDVALRSGSERVGPHDAKVASLLARQTSLAQDRLRMEQRLEEAALENQRRSVTDEATGLPNLAGFVDAVDARLGGRRRDDRAKDAVVLVIEFDGLSTVSDALGSAASVTALRHGATVARGVAREEDVVARVGDTRLAVFAELPDGDALHAMQRHLSAARLPLDVDGLRVELRPVIGIATTPGDAEDAAGLLRCAGMAVGLARNVDRPWAAYDAGLDDAVSRRLLLASDLPDAIARGQITLAYQPQVDASTGETVAFEALARWHHPALGHVSPVEFIEVAERVGLAGRLTDHVINTALAACAAWQEEHRGVRVAVNLSPAALTPGLPSTLDLACATHRLHPRMVVCEVTESLITDAAASDIVDLLRARGSAISVDDFGTGYASFEQLLNIRRPDELKIDRAFIERVAVEEQHAVMVRTMIDMARGLNLTVVAEGVEDLATADWLREAGCHVLQGYGIAKPLADPVAWLRDPTWAARRTPEQAIVQELGRRAAAPSAGGAAEAS